MMFHVKRPTRRWLFASLIVSVPILAACAGINNDPSGWSAPVPIDAADSDNVVIVRTGGGHVAAVDFDTNTVLWEFPDRNDRFPGLLDEIDARGFYGTPAIALNGDELIFGDHDEGLVFAIRADGTSGRIVFDTGDKIIGGIVVDDDGRSAYVATADQRVYAIDIENPPIDRASARWIFTGAGNEIWGTAALADSDAHGRLLLVPSMDGNLYALQRDSQGGGEPGVAWVFQTGGAIAGNVVVQQTVAYVGSFDGRFYAIDIETGEAKWSQPGDGWFWTTPLIDSGVVYAPDLEGSVWAWDADNGRLLEGFPYESGDPVRAKPLFSEDRSTMLILTRSKHVHFIDPTNGLGIWTSADLEDSSLPNRVLADPILQNGRMLINDDRGLVLEITPPEEILAGGDYQTELSLIRLAGS